MELTTSFQKIATGTSKTYGQATGYLELWAKYNSQDVANNKSNVTVELRLVVTVGYIGNYQATYWSISGDLSASGNLGSGSYTSRTLGTATGDITHESDGTKSVSFSGSFNPTAWGSSMSVSGSATLPTLHTPPTLSLTSVTENVSRIGQNTLFVNYVSNKTFNVSYSFSDSATPLALRVYYKNGNPVTIGSSTLNASSGSVTFNNFVVSSSDITNGKTIFYIELEDNLHGKTRIATPEYNVVQYEKVNIETTSSKVKRAGQTTGEASLTLNGYWYNATVGNTTNALTMKFKYWKVGDSEPSSYISIPTSANTGSNNNITISSWKLKNGNTVITNFNKEYSYYVKVYIEDSVGGSSRYTTATFTVPKGVWIMAKYKDHVDFMKLTVQKYNPFEYSTSETICGVWNDGNSEKYIYRKVLGDIGSLGNEASKSFSTSGMNISKVLKIDGVINYSTNYTAPLDRVRTYYNSSNNTITVYNFDNLAVNNGYVYIEYIKT